MASPHFIFYWWQSFDLRIALPKQFCQPMWTVRLDTSWQFLNARFIKQGEVWWQCRCNHIGVCETVWSTGESKKREISTCNLSLCPYAGNIHWTPLSNIPNYLLCLWFFMNYQVRYLTKHFAQFSFPVTKINESHLEEIGKLRISMLYIDFLKWFLCLRLCLTHCITK